MTIIVVFVVVVEPEVVVATRWKNGMTIIVVVVVVVEPEVVVATTR